MDELENKSDEELWEIVKKGVNLLPHVPQSESNRAKRILEYRNSKKMKKPMQKSNAKQQLVQELTAYFKALDVQKLYKEPEHKTSKDWLAEVSAILKNLDETDYTKFMDLRQHLHDSIPFETRKHAAEQIDGFIRGKVAEYKLYDFGNVDDTQNQELPFWDYIHPKIVAVSKSRFMSQHYADSVEAAFKEIEEKVCEIVKDKTGKELSGADLMNTAFSPNNPVVVLESMDTKSGKDVQLGYMQIFAGAMTGIRNPKAHRNIKISEENAIHLLFLASLLMNNLENGTITGRQK